MPALREVFAEYDVRFDPRRQLAQGSQRVNSLTGRLRNMLPRINALSGAFGQLAAAVGGVAMVRGMSRFVEATIAAGDELDKTAQQLGLTTRQYQVLRHQATLGGVDNAAFANSLGQLQRQALQASRGSLEAADSFERLGVAVTDESGELRDVNDLLIDIARGLTDMENSTERVAISSTLMGRSGRRLLPMMAGIASGTADAEAELESLGGGMSELAVQRSVELTDNLARLSVAWDSVRSAIATRAIPAIDWVVQKFSRLVPDIGELTDSLKLLEGALFGVGVVAAIVAAATITTWGPVVGAILAAAAAAAVLAIAYDQVARTIDGGDTALRRFLDSSELLGEDGTTGLVLLLGDAWDRLTRRIGIAVDYVQDFLELIRPVTEIIDYITSGMRYIGGGFLADLGGAAVRGLRGASQGRAAEEENRQSAAQDRRNRRVSTTERGIAERRAGLTQEDIAGRPVSLPGGPRSALIYQGRAGGGSPPQGGRRETNVTAPMQVDVEINEATDVQRTRREVQDAVRRAQDDWTRQLTATLEDRENDLD